MRPERSRYRGPLDALDYAIASAFCVTERRGRPGEVIQRLPAEQRELLAELTSDQTRATRIPWLGTSPVESEKAKFRHAVQVAGGRV